jgi:GntR family transcriptional regulator / MocR family aminotransferase
MPKTRKLQVAGWHPDPRSPNPLYRQVYDRFRQAIHNGTLRPEERLPSTRSLASQLSAARGTIDLAYSLLASEGYVISRGAAGTFVAPGLTAALRRSPNRSHASTGVPAQPRAARAVIAPFQMGVPALDDDYDSEFRYGSRPLPALKSLDEAGRVLYVGTFSKVLFTGPVDSPTAGGRHASHRAGTDSETR